MLRRLRRLLSLFTLLLACAAAQAQQVEKFKVLFHNCHNYIAADSGQGKPKSEREKLALFQVWKEEDPDILLMCEVGGPEQLLEIEDQLKMRGLDYPHKEWVEAADDVRHVALFSRYPIVERGSHDDLHYDLKGKSTPVLRGFLEADIQVDKDYRIKVYVAHLKSKKTVKAGPETSAEMRLAEAKLLREKVEEDLESNPEGNFLVAGDLNDTPKSKPISILLGFKLTDLKPGDEKGYTGTFYNWKKKRYERIDYMLASPGLKKELVEGGARLRDDKTAKIASDHYPLSAEFVAEER